MHLITTRVATSIILSKIKGEMMIIILLNFANLQRLKSALKKKNAEEPTIELRDYITKTSTKLNSVINFLQKFNNVSMEIIARLLTLLKTLRSGSFITYSLKIRTLIFTFSTLKLNGVLIIMNITRLNAYMPTIFKILEESLICSDMILSYARTGKAALLSPVMMKDVNG